jgi:adenylate kinase family enzyme
MQRISIIGTCGAGKTTLAQALSARLGIPRVELDALYHGPGWTETPRDLFRERVSQAVSGPEWVVDGNYSAVRDLVWARADTVVWLDYPFPVTFSRVTRRTLRRLLTQEELWNGNRESLRLHFSRDSLLVFAVRTHWSRRRNYVRELALPEYAHLTAYRHANLRETRRWLESLATASILTAEGPA